MMVKSMLKRFGLLNLHQDFMIILKSWWRFNKPKRFNIDFTVITKLITFGILYFLFSSYILLLSLIYLTLLMHSYNKHNESVIILYYIILYYIIHRYISPASSNKNLRIISPVSWSCWLCLTVFLQRSKNPTINKCPRYDYKLSDGEAPVLIFWECGIPFHCHYSQVHSYIECLYLLGSHGWVK